MAQTKTNPAAVGLKLAEIGGLFATFCVAMDPMVAAVFALGFYVISSKV